MEEAKAVKAVLPFFVFILLKDNFNAVQKLIAVFLIINGLVSFSSLSTGLESFFSFPSFSSTILVENFSANSRLWVTIITSLSFDISLINSIICSLVFVSSAPVGSSARIISGLLASALAIATRCI